MSLAELLLVLLPESDILQIWVRQIFVKKIPKIGVDMTTELNRNRKSRRRTLEIRTGCSVLGCCTFVEQNQKRSYTQEA